MDTALPAAAGFSSLEVKWIDIGWWVDFGAGFIQVLIDMLQAHFGDENYSAWTSGTFLGCARAARDRAFGTRWLKRDGKCQIREIHICQLWR